MSNGRERRALALSVVAAALVVGLTVFALVSKRSQPIEAQTFTPHAAPLVAQAPEHAPQVELSAAERVATPAPAVSELTNVAEEPTPTAAPAQVFWGRVIDDSGAPIAGASITSGDGTRQFRRGFVPRTGGDVARTDENGLFSLRIPSNGDPFVFVRAAEFGPACLPLDDAHSTRELALDIALVPAGQIEFHLLDAANGDLSDARVRVWTRASNLSRPVGSRLSLVNPEWTATTDWMGLARVVDLPAEVTLSIEVVASGEQEPVRFHDLVLERGEVRVCELTVGAGSRITGVLLSHDGRALAHRELWLTNTLKSNWKQRASCLFEPSDGTSAFASITTDELGGFEIAGVPRGRWWLGPAPVAAHRIVIRGTGRETFIGALDPSRVPDPQAPCSVATCIELDGERPLDLTLRVQCGLYITGRVLDPLGTPTFAGVQAHGVDVGGRLDAAVATNGSFVLGPLPEGRFALWAESLGNFADSEQVVFPAGAREVELRLRSLCVFAGVLTGVDPSESEYHAFAISEVGIALLPIDAEGSFELRGMPAGKYDLVASGLNGWFGSVRGALFEPGDAAAPVAIPMHPGARVRVRYDGPASRVRVRIYDGDWLVAFADLAQGAPTVCTVPPGRLRVEVRLDELSVQQRDIDVVAGELTNIDFKFE